ncbi:MAG TPA: hypothetical protein PJ982_19910, partial [Lacipirellulaceae bacterium]|nr:hypothetical protein [Lacipirellulaceae bacterium]
MLPMGDLPGGSFVSSAAGVSEFGAAIIGYGTTAAGQRAFYWDALGGMRELQPFLTAEFGLVMPGWTLTFANAITPDGRVIVGNGMNPSGFSEGWIVDLSAITDATWAGGAGSWDDAGSWKYGFMPRAIDDVSITPAAGLVATGPTAVKTVASLTVDATASGVTDFKLQNDFTATAGVAVEDGGRITLTGQQLDAGSGLTINGAGRVQGYGIVYGPIGGTAGTAGVVNASRTLALTEPLEVGARQARILSLGAANLGPDASLEGGSITAPNGLFVGGSNTLRGHGTVTARVSAGIGSLIVAEGGNLTLGIASSPAGFFSDGDLMTGPHTVTINDANEAVLGSLTVLGDGVDGGTLVAGTALPAQTRTHLLIEQGKNLVGRGNVAGSVKNHGAVVGDGLALHQRIVF